MYIYVYMYANRYMYTCVYVRVYIYVCVSICTCMYICTNTRKWLYTPIKSAIYTYILKLRVCACLCLYWYVVYMHVYTRLSTNIDTLVYTRIHVYIKIYQKSGRYARRAKLWRLLITYVHTSGKSTHDNAILICNYIEREWPMYWIFMQMYRIWFMQTHLMIMQMYRM